MVPGLSRREALHAVAVTVAVTSAGCIGFGLGENDDPDLGIENQDDEDHFVRVSVETAGGEGGESAYRKTTIKSTLPPDERVSHADVLEYHDPQSTYRVTVMTDGKQAAEQTVRVDGPESSVGDLLVTITGTGKARIDFGPDVSVGTWDWF